MIRAVAKRLGDTRISATAEMNRVRAKPVNQAVLKIKAVWNWLPKTNPPHNQKQRICTGRVLYILEGVFPREKNLIPF